MIAEFLGLSSMLMPSSYTDIKRMEVSDRSILFSGFACLAFNIFMCIHTRDSGGLLRMGIGALVGGIIGVLMFLFGMGFGDVKLMFVMGGWLGIGSFITALTAASVLGSMYGFIWLKLVKKKSIKSVLPFVPFLALGSYAALYFKFLLEGHL